MDQDFSTKDELEEEEAGKVKNDGNDEDDGDDEDEEDDTDLASFEDDSDSM